MLSVSEGCVSPVCYRHIHHRNVPGKKRWFSLKSKYIFYRNVIYAKVFP